MSEIMEEKKDKEKEAAGIDEESDSGGLEEESPRQSWLKVGAKIFGAIALFYFFICSLDLLGDAFQLLAGKGAGDFFSSDSSLLNNPIVGLMIGVLGTVILQSSSTFTSIIISMTGSFLEPEDAIPMIIGSNVGTSVTSTLVALSQAGERNMFRRAFSAATVHDMFNWCTIIIMLPLEIGTGFLEFLSDKTATAFVGEGGAKEIKTIQYLTEPFTQVICQTNSTVLELWAIGECEDCRFMKVYCPTEEDPNEKCKFLLNIGHLEDWQAGLILLLMSLVVLCTALVLMVKVLNSLLKGAIANAIKRVLNPTFSNSVISYLYGYLVIIIGAFLTFLVQSSSVFTSTITPLVGLGILTLKTVYPLFLGANIGTTTTGLLAALARDSEALHDALQVAFVHLYFNISGILLYYPFPFMRIPIPLAKILGNTVAKYRWFAIAYLIGMFLILPFLVMVLSLNTIVFISVLTPLAFLLVVVIIMNVIQRSRFADKLLPKILRNWDFLPAPLHSLKPYDRILAGWSCCKRCGSSNLETSPTSTSQEDVEKPDMEYPTESDEEKGKLGISNGGYQEW